MASINTGQTLSVVIPTINEAERLPLLLADLNLYPNKFEVIVVDGGSIDLTSVIARLGGARVIQCQKKNRGKQLQIGSLSAKGEWLLFLHADCRLNKDWPSTVNKIIVNSLYKKYAWFFNFEVKERGLIWRALEISIFIRSYLFQKPYGDQGLLISQDLYFKTGGYKGIPIMEDLDLIIRLGRVTKVKGLGVNLVTSNRKIVKGRVIQNAIKNAILRYKWNKGENVEKLAKMYYSSDESKENYQ